MILNTLLTIVHIIIALCIIALVLVQHGKGADAGTAFGSGASGTVFGAAGKTNFLATLTKWFVLLFFITSFSMMVMSGKSAKLEISNSVINEIAPVNEVPTLSVEPKGASAE